MLLVTPLVPAHRLSNYALLDNLPYYLLNEITALPIVPVAKLPVTLYSIISEGLPPFHPVRWYGESRCKKYKCVQVFRQ